MCALRKQTPGIVAVACGLLETVNLLSTVYSVIALGRVVRQVLLLQRKKKKEKDPGISVHRDFDLISSPFPWDFHRTREE